VRWQRSVQTFATRAERRNEVHTGCHYAKLWSSQMWHVSYLLAPEIDGRAGWRCREGQAVIPARLDKPTRPRNQQDEERISSGNASLLFIALRPNCLRTYARSLLDPAMGIEYSGRKVGQTTYETVLSMKASGS